MADEEFAKIEAEYKEYLKEIARNNMKLLKGEDMYYLTIDGYRISDKPMTLKEILQRFCHTTGKIGDIEKHGYRLEAAK
jgi:hypothetical protein